MRPRTGSRRLCHRVDGGPDHRVIDRLLHQLAEEEDSEPAPAQAVDLVLARDEAPPLGRIRGSRGSFRDGQGHRVSFRRLSRARPR